MTAIAIYFQSPLLKSFPIFPINQKLPRLFPEPEKKYFPDVFPDRGNAGKSLLNKSLRSKLFSNSIYHTENLRSPESRLKEERRRRERDYIFSYDDKRYLNISL